VIFRDLKPANVMLTPHQRVYLIDFGIARHFTPGKQHDTIAFGSPGYAAPEQYGKAQTTPRSDIFSLGALLHHLLTGADPSEQPMRFAPITGPVPAELAWLIAQMVDLDADQRPASMAAIKAALENMKDTWQREQVPAQASTTSSAPPAPPQVPVHHPVVTPSAVQAAAPPSVRPVSTRSGRHYMSARARLAWTAGGTVCVLIYFLARTMSQGNQYTGLNYLATTYTEQTATQVAMSPQEGVTYTLAWSPDGSRIASGGNDGDVRIWNARTGTILLGYAGSFSYMIHSLAWSPDGSKIASTGPENLIEVWDVATGQNIRFYETGNFSSLQVLAWSPDGTRIASSGPQGKVLVWEVSTGKTLLTYQGQNNVVNSVAWSPDSKLLASGGSNGLVEVWDATSGRTLYSDSRHSGAVEQIAWSPDGMRLASASTDYTVQVWDATTGANMLVYSGHQASVLALAWSPDGQALASAGQDTTVQVWWASSGALLYTYHGHNQTVYTVAWSPTCKEVALAQPCRIASGGADDAQVWDALTGGGVLIYPSSPIPVWK
jgi:WD40 repeat protein